jgi:hypothetical protein
MRNASRRRLAPSPTCLICGKVVSTKVGCGRFHGKLSRVVPALCVKRGLDVSTKFNRQHDLQITRGSIFIGATTSLLCAPAVVRAASLMPVRGLILPIERPHAGFCQRLFYHSLDSGLRAGRVTTVLNGSIVSEADARRIVAYARAQGWFPQINGEVPGCSAPATVSKIGASTQPRFNFAP